MCLSIEELCSIGLSAYNRSLEWMKSASAVNFLAGFDCPDLVNTKVGRLALPEVQNEKGNLRDCLWTSPART